MRIVGHGDGGNFAEDVLGQDPGSQRQREGRAGRFEGELDASAIDTLDLDVAPELGAGLELNVGGVLQHPVGEQHVAGAELDAVRPAHVVPDSDRVAEMVVGAGPRSGQQRLHLLPGADSSQPLVDEAVDVARVVFRLEKRVQRGDRPDQRLGHRAAAARIFRGLLHDRGGVDLAGTEQQHAHQGKGGDGPDPNPKWSYESKPRYCRC